MARSDRFSLADQVALVIGGSSGIGRQIALGFQKAGAHVAIVGKTPSKVEEVAHRLKVANTTASAYAADVTDLARLREIMAEIVVREGKLDILVNSQGTTLLKPAEEFTGAEFDFIIDTNLKSVFFACTEAGRHMLPRGRGAIINIASVASYRGFQQSALYSMSKRGVLALTETLATEWATRGVRVNGIAPGFFMTALNRDRMSPERKANALRRTPMGRFGELDELVGAAIYLASPSASYVTGEIIRVDGGYLAAGL